MDVRYPGHSGGQGVEASAQRDYPVVSPQVVECLSKVGVLEADAGGEFPGAVRCEDAVPLVGQETHQLDSYQGLLGLCADAFIWTGQALGF